MPGREGLPAREPLDIIEAMHSTPARRYMKSDPIPEPVLKEIMDAAIRGPSGGNSQGWGWVVVRDQALKTQIAALYRDVWCTTGSGSRKETILGNPEASTLGTTGYMSAEHLAEHMGECPVLVIPVLVRGAGSTNPRAGASVYGAAQHLMLAARAFGIGSVMTTLSTQREEQVKALLGLPAEALTMGLIPLGYPARGRWAEPKRNPIEEVVHWDRWGNH